MNSARGHRFHYDWRGHVRFIKHRGALWILPLLILAQATLNMVRPMWRCLVFAPWRRFSSMTLTLRPFARIPPFEPFTRKWPWHLWIQRSAIVFALKLPSLLRSDPLWQSLHDLFRRFMLSKSQK